MYYNYRKVMGTIGSHGAAADAKIVTIDWCVTDAKSVTDDGLYL